MTRSRAAWGALLVAVAVLFGAVPFRSILPLFPCGNDAMAWIGQTDPSRPGWVSWVLFDNHFVAYRPVTGLLFTLNHLVGEGTWGWRTVDIGLHVVTGLLVAWVWVALSRRASWGWGVVAAALFLASPIGESVVPFVARRSYSLATALGLAALAIWASAEAPGARAGLRRGIASALLLAAVLANETAYVLVPVLALVSVSQPRERGWAPAIGSLVPLVGITAIGVVLRLAVLGRLGGYQHKLTARVEDGVRLVQFGSSPVEVFGLAWGQATLPSTPSGDAPFLLALGGTAVGLVLAAWALGASVHALRNQRDPFPLLLCVWATGYALLAATSGTWFVRMAYPMAVPVALWLGWALAEGCAAARRRSFGALHLVPLVLVLAARIQVATPVQGMDRKPIREQYRSSRFVRSVVRDLATLPSPALVWAAVPVDFTRVGSTLHWIRVQAPEGIEVRGLAMTEPHHWPRGRMLERKADVFRPTGGALWDPRGPARGPRAAVPVRALVRDQRATWLIDDGLLLLAPRR